MISNNIISANTIKEKNNENASFKSVGHSLFVSFGVALFIQQEFLIGGTAGVAFLGSYANSWSFGQLFLSLISLFMPWQFGVWVSFSA